MDNRERVLDWRGEYDPRSRNFAAVAEIDDDYRVHNRIWECNAWLDQGREGACVGFGWSHELCAKPRVHMVDNNFAQGIFHRARQLDEWDGEDYEGTSVLAGVKAVLEITNKHNLKLYDGYRWAFGVYDVVRTIVHKGPVVLGIDWYDNMYEPDEDNFIHASGPIAGGHCILANGFAYVKADKNKANSIYNMDWDRSRIRVHNSWGVDWGINGEARITLTDLQTLFENGGEACVPWGRRN